MIIVKKINNGISWVLNTGRENKTNETKKRKGLNSMGHIKESKRLKYCESCERVWEIGYTGSVHSYGHLPTYKLPRVTCKICQGVETGRKGKYYYNRKENKSQYHYNNKNRKEDER